MDCFNGTFYELKKKQSKAHSVLVKKTVCSNNKSTLKKLT
jgi:hypothetical protein